MESDETTNSTVSRRGMMALVGTGAVGAVAIGAGSTVLSDTAGATMQVETESLEVTSPNGTVEEIHLFLTDARAEYENVGPKAGRFEFTTNVNGEEVLEHNIRRIPLEGYSRAEIGDDSGWIEWDSGMFRPGAHGSVDLFDSPAFSSEDFEVPEDGASETFDLDIEVVFEVYAEDDEDHENPLVTASDSTPAQLTINNEADSSGGENGDNGSGGSDPEGSMNGPEVNLVVRLPDGEEVGG